MFSADLLKDFRSPPLRHERLQKHEMDDKCDFNIQFEYMGYVILNVKRAKAIKNNS